MKKILTVLLLSVAMIFAVSCGIQGAPMTAEEAALANEALTTGISTAQSDSSAKQIFDGSGTFTVSDTLEFANADQTVQYSLKYKVSTDINLTTVETFTKFKFNNLVINDVDLDGHDDCVVTIDGVYGVDFTFTANILQGTYNGLIDIGERFPGLHVKIVDAAGTTLLDHWVNAQFKVTWDFALLGGSGEYKVEGSVNGQELSTGLDMNWGSFNYTPAG